jgi:hypothetical protein
LISSDNCLVKSSTVFGDLDNNDGIVVSAFEELFDYIQNMRDYIQREIRVSFLEFYNENIFDVMHEKIKQIDLKEEAKAGFSEFEVPYIVPRSSSNVKFQFLRSPLSKFLVPRTTFPST